MVKNEIDTGKIIIIIKKLTSAKKLTMVEKRFLKERAISITLLLALSPIEPSQIW